MLLYITAKFRSSLNIVQSLLTVIRARTVVQRSVNTEALLHNSGNVVPYRST
jgi:hypothetical protein